MTTDLDIVTDAAAQDTFIVFMESRGFVTLHRSSGYSNHLHAQRDRGRVMSCMSVTKRLIACSRRQRNCRPEHLIAMKVQAMKDAPERVWQDLVAYLLGLEGEDRDEGRGFWARGSKSAGVSSIGDCDVDVLDLGRDVPTTSEDIEVMRRLRRETPSWFSLTPAQIQRLIPDGALERRPATRRDAQPFTLPSS